MRTKTALQIKNIHERTVVPGTHTGKPGVVSDRNLSKTGAITITVNK